MFHHAPAVIIEFLELGHERWEVNFSLAQFAENTLPDSLEIIPAIFCHLFTHARVTILEVEVPYSLAVFAQSLDGVSAPKAIVAAIEY